MENDNFFFYLPQKTFTSFELLSIRYKSPNNIPVTLKIQYNDSTVTLPNPKKDGEMLYWSSDSVPDFSCSRVSKFNLIANEDSTEVDFDNLVLVSSPKYFNHTSLKNIFIFCFLSGYFARKSDYEMISLHATSNLKYVNLSKLDVYQSLCKEYKEKLSQFEDIRNNKLKITLDNRQEYQENASKKRIQIFEEYNEAFKNTPILNLNYPLEPKNNYLHTSIFSTVFQTSINFSTESTSLSFRMPTSRSNPDLKELNRLSDISEQEKFPRNANDQISNAPSTVQPLYPPIVRLAQRRTSCTPKVYAESLANVNWFVASSQIYNTQQQQTSNYKEQNINKNCDNQNSLNQQNLEDQGTQQQDQIKNEQTSPRTPPNQQLQIKSQPSNDIKNKDSSFTKSHYFPEVRQGTRSPSQYEIRMFLSELPLIFPINVEKRTFCNIFADDPDPQCNKMLIFNTIHFLSLFSEFTGIIYQYRIEMGEGGWYKLEDRITGIEVKKEVNTKNTILSPLRTAIMNCLKKIVFEFNLKAKDNEDFDSK